MGRSANCTMAGLGVSMAVRREWLVTDQRGGFAMGTLQGVRTRKYHGFFLGVSGRAEAAFLTTFEVELDGKRLWPMGQGEEFDIEITENGPRWAWTRPDGVISFQVLKNEPAGIRLSWNWSGSKDLNFKLRPLFAMRPLHEIEGNYWTLEDLGHGVFRVDGQTDHELSQNQVYSRWSDPITWREEPAWFRNFFYEDEHERNYTDRENLYSAGYFETCLRGGNSISWIAAQERADLEPVRDVTKERAPVLRRSDYPYPALDFVLDHPAGIVAGFPWFGEIGRDTFVSLPGIVCARLSAGENPASVAAWVYELLERWGSWILETGMLPHKVESDGSHDWNSADGTLWFCHALAALWVLSLDKSDEGEEPFPDFEERFAPLLRAAISSISEGRHMFLRRGEKDLIEVTEAHVTWMDSELDGAPVVPRTGALPEINALWFQARFLNFLWSGEEALYDLERLGSEVLRIREEDRPNQVFLHSLPLAPSFILKDWQSLRSDLRNLKQRFVTPVGLRSLAPENPAYRAKSFHQGGAWSWLGGHFKMAETRLEQNLVSSKWPSDFQSHAPIEGHVPAVFDAEPPYEPVGVPAGASGLACSIENTARESRGLDSKLSRILTRLWIKDMKRA